MTHKPSKVAAAKMLFSSVYVIDATCFDVFCSMNCWKTLFFLKVCRYCEIFTTTILLFSFKQVFWKKSIFYAIGDSALLILMLMQSSKKRYCIHTWKTFVADFFYDDFHTLYVFNCPHISLQNYFSFFEKLKISLKACFYIIL